MIPQDTTGQRWQLRRGGRWDAILSACADEPRTRTQIIAAVRRPGRPGKGEKRKVWKIIQVLAELGHLSPVGPAWRANPATLEALATAPEHQPHTED